MSTIPAKPPQAEAVRLSFGVHLTKRVGDQSKGQVQGLSALTTSPTRRDDDLFYRFASSFSIIQVRLVSSRMGTNVP